MGTFSKHVTLPGNIGAIPKIASEIEREFRADGFEVSNSDIVSGGVDISITKGGLFKAVLGMRTALKITLTPQVNGILFDANVGIFGQQVVPTIIMWYFLWPVLLTQIWGLVNQAKLDDKALAIAQRVISNEGSSINTNKSVKFCPGCGTPLPSIDAKFCVNCGLKI